MSAYYNEIEPFAAQWLRNLIAGGHIAPGDVDERDIRDVHPDDLKGYTQAHFFAGLGGWSYALRLAGWPDDEPVWTGSCPCQPFSAAGAGGGFADERHLWPHFFHLIEQCRPRRCFGEQVASRDGLAWLDLVQTDLEGAGYATAALDLCAAGVGAPHIRQRLYWVASPLDNPADPRYNNARQHDGGSPPFTARPLKSGIIGGMGFTDSAGWEQGRTTAEAARHGRPVIPTGDLCGLGDPLSSGWGQVGLHSGGGLSPRGAGPRTRGRDAGAYDGTLAGHPGPTNGFWRDPDWLLCRDGKWRPVSAGSFPLAHGVPARVGKIRAAGNAIVPALAAEFIRAYVG